MEKALEEMDVCLTSLEPVAEAYGMPSVSSGRIWLGLAPYSAGNSGSKEEGFVADEEQLTVEEIGHYDLARIAAVGQLSDMTTLVFLQSLQLRRPELFKV